MQNHLPASSPLRLLDHPWYRAWEMGKVSPSALQHYAREYYWQVAHFPRYLSCLHSQLPELSDRQVVLRNLCEEEDLGTPHPELWLDFAEAVGNNRVEVRSGAPSPQTQTLVDQFWGLCRQGAPEALGALLAYESQVPEIAQFKSEALQRHYLSAENAATGTRFFKVHAEADIWHTQELTEIRNRMGADEQRRADASGVKARQALWSFLDGMPN